MQRLGEGKVSKKAKRRRQQKQTKNKNRGVSTMKPKAKLPFQRIVISEEKGKLKAKSVPISFEQWCKDMDEETRGMRIDPETGEPIEPDY
jgi:hypothetical protein